MQNRYIAIGFSNIADDAMATLGTTVITAMTDNPNFETPVPALTDIQLLLDDYRLKLAATRKGSPLNTSEKNVSRQALEKGLRQLAFYVDAVADGALHVILSSGFPVKPLRSSLIAPAIPERLRLSDTAQSGQIRFDFNPVKKAWEYEYCYATEVDDNGNIRWGDILSTTSSRNNIIAPLIPGVVCRVRVRARNGKGVSDWSEAVSLMAR